MASKMELKFKAPEAVDPITCIPATLSVNSVAPGIVMYIEGK